MSWPVAARMYMPQRRASAGSETPQRDTREADCDPARRLSSGEGVRVESRLIDEGFGSLDQRNRGAATGVLEQLHAAMLKT